MSEQSPPQRVSFRKNSSLQTNQKTVFTHIFIRTLGLQIICSILFDTYREFERDKFTGKWFARMLQSDAVIWFQRYQRSDLKRGSISLARLID
jgi:hypothetical protein